jgi:lysophospholipase L1-like esterase
MFSNTMTMNKLTLRRNTQLLIIALGLVFFMTSGDIPSKYAKEAQKWGKDIQKFEQLDKSEQYPDDAILFTGSSSITIWKTINEDMAPYHAINRGFGGSKFSDLACYIGRIVYPHKFKALVIFEANDISGSASDKTPQEDVDLFRDIVKTVRKKFPGKPIFLIEITPTKLRWAVWPKIKEANRLLKQTCESLPHVYFIETAASYLNEKGEPRTELAQADMLHQNRDGYLIWMKLIKDKLDQTFATTEKSKR